MRRGAIARHALSGECLFGGRVAADDHIADLHHEPILLRVAFLPALLVPVALNLFDEEHSLAVRRSAVLVADMGDDVWRPEVSIRERLRVIPVRAVKCLSGSRASRNRYAVRIDRDELIPALALVVGV